MAGGAYPARGSVGATGLIIVRNAEKTIAAAVGSLTWCERVVVVDQQSEDKTREIARSQGAEVLLGEVTGTADPARAAAVELVGRGWVVMLDADEVIPPPLARRLAQVIDDDAVSGVRVARRNMLLGRWARGAGWWPDPQLRAFRATAVAFPERAVHGAAALVAGASLLDLSTEADAHPELALLHFNYMGYEDWVERANRYTSMHVADVRVRRPRPGYAFARAFLRRFLQQGGWRLGRYGVELSALGATYDWLLVNKAGELSRGGTRQIERAYQQLAESTLRGELEDL